jgi:inosine-uridine nucleoside N-ribohydrolase
MAVTHPDLLTFEERHVDVELKGEHTRGMTLVDMRRVKNNLVKNAHVAMSIERDKGMKLLLETIGSYN